MGTQDRITELEEQISKTKYNKRTQHAIGLMKAQVASLRKKAEGQKKAGGGYGYSIKKTGDATVVMVGFPSVGKSTLLNAITNQESEVGSYDFTTLDAIPGLLEHKGAKIQIFDLPGLVGGAAAGTGRGKEVLSVIKNADLCLIIVDVHKPKELDVIRSEIYDAGIRINEKKPDVKFKKAIKGGITLSKTVPLNIDDRTVKDMMNELGIINADVLIRSKVNEDQLIDAILGNRKYLNAVIILNKCDSIDPAKAEKIRKEIGAEIMISAETGMNLDKLKDFIFDKLEFIRIFLKEPSKEADMGQPIIMKKDCTINDVCSKLHRDMLRKFKFSRVWGESAKHPGQRLMLNHMLKDEDILEIHLI